MVYTVCQNDLPPTEKDGPVKIQRRMSTLLYYWNRQGCPTIFLVPTLHDFTVLLKSSILFWPLKSLILLLLLSLDSASHCPTPFSPSQYLLQQALGWNYVHWQTCLKPSLLDWQLPLSQRALFYEFSTNENQNWHPWNFVWCSWYAVIPLGLTHLMTLNEWKLP